MRDEFYFWYERTPGGDWSGRAAGNMPSHKRGESNAPRMSQIYTISRKDVEADRSLSTLEGMKARFPPPEEPVRAEPVRAGLPDHTPPKPAPKGLTVRPTGVPGEWDVELRGVALRVLDNLPQIDTGESFDAYLRRVLPKDCALVFETQIRGRVVPEKIRA